MGQLYGSLKKRGFVTCSTPDSLTISVVPAVTRETAIMQIKEEIARIEREKNKLFETLMQIEGKSLE